MDEAEVLIPPVALTDLHEAVLLFLRGSSASASQFDADASYDVTMVLIHGLTYLAQIQEMEGVGMTTCAPPWWHQGVLAQS